jgi:hypothetical protein
MVTELMVTNLIGDINIKLSKVKNVVVPVLN